MPFTGERFTPEIAGNIEMEHLHRYLLACEVSAGQVVLDIACGEGYGSAMLANNASKVFGVDISEEVIKHAGSRYTNQNLEYLVGSCSDIPLSDSSADLVVSFETIEHHDQHELMMQEIKRVLKNTGVLLISSPDKYYYSEEPGFNNPHHIKELYQQEFKSLIEKNFTHVKYFGQRVVYGSAILAETSTAKAVTYWKEGDVIKTEPGVSKPIFWMALASDSILPNITVGIFEQPLLEAESVRLMTKDLENAIVLLNLKDEYMAQAVEIINQHQQELKSIPNLFRSISKLISLIQKQF